MIDYNRISANRLHDRASPSFVTFLDRLRTWRMLRNRRIEAGKSITIKKGVEISVCGSGKLTIGDHAFFHSRCWILMTMPHPVVTIGRWVHLGRNCVVAAKNSISIGDYTIFAPNCYIVDHEHGFSKDDIILNQKSVLKKVEIGRDCYFGAGAVVLGGVTVGDGAVIGANSVVTCDIPSEEVWAGSPARYIKKRGD